MGLSKEQVEKHIAGIQKRLTSAQERALHGYEFARLCVEVQNYQDAIRYLHDYLSVQEKDFRAHKLMGLACESEGLLDRALLHYNRSLKLREDQRGVAISVAKLYCKIENPPTEALKACLARIEAYSNVHSLVLAITEKICSIEGERDPDLATKLAEHQLSSCKDDLAAHIHLANHYHSSGEVEKALTHCLSQRNKKQFIDNREWLTCVLHIAEHCYASMKEESVQDSTAQCRVLITVLDHLSLLFNTSGTSGSRMVSVLLKYDKVLFAALQALKAQQPHVHPVHLVVLREQCAQYYLLLANYMYWSHRFKASFTASHSVKHAQIGNLCLLASLSFPPPNLDSIPLVGGMEQRRKLEAWHTRSCRRLCVVSRQLLLVSRVKGDIYLGGLAKIIEGQGGKLAVIKTLFTENIDLRGVDVKFASSPIMYNIRRSYIAAETEHLLAHTPTIPLPSETEALVCDKIYFLGNGQDLPALLWLCLCLRAVNISTPVYQWLPNVFVGLRMDLPGSYIKTAAADTLSLTDVEAMLVLSVHTLQLVLTSPPSHPPSLPNSLLHQLPGTMATELQGSDLSKYCQWWTYVHQYVSKSSSGSNAEVKRVISEGLSLVRGCQPLRLNVTQLACLAKHFQQRAELVVEANESKTGKDKSVLSSLIEDLLWRSCHYWEIVVAILTKKERGSKFRRPPIRHEETGGSISVTSGEPSGVALLNEAHMALGDTAAYRRDMPKALGHYSKVKTSLAAWNQAQIYLVMAQQGSYGENGESGGELKKKAKDCLDIAISQLTAADKDLKETIEEKLKEVKKMIAEEEEEESRKDVAVSLTYNSSPETSVLIPRKSSTPAASSGARQSRLSPFSPDKKTPSGMDSLREELKEKDTLITSMSEQLKSLQADVSALKLHVSATATPGYPSPHLSRSFQHTSPQAMGIVGVPQHMLTPSGVAMYHPHPSLSSSFHSPLLQSPVGMTVQQQRIVYHTSPQPQLTPLPPHLSPASNPGLSISGTVIGGPQVAPGVSYRPGVSSVQPGGMPLPPSGAVLSGQPGRPTTSVGYRPGGMQASNFPGSVLQPRGATLGEQPILSGQVTTGIGYRPGGIQASNIPGSTLPQSGSTLGEHMGSRGLPPSGAVLSEQSTFSGHVTTGAGGASNLQPGSMLPPSGATLVQHGANRGVLQPSGAVLGLSSGNQMILPNQMSYQTQPLQGPTLAQQQILYQQQHHTGQQPRVPTSQPTPPPSTSPVPPPPDPSTTGFVLKPGTFLPATTEPESQSVFDTLSNLSFSVPSTTSTALFDSSGGFKFTPPSVTQPSTESKSEAAFGGSPAEQQEGMLRLEPRSSPPKSCSAGLDFASLFKTSTTASSTPFQFGLSIDPPKIPSPTEQEPNDDLNTSAHEPDIHFEPIVTLPEVVEITSGEENEEAVFAERAKLFRFDSSMEQWKERGIGEMKILVNREARKARVLMRRDQVLKICCNHVIMRDMSLTPMQGSNKAWTWFTPGDFSEETETPEKFAVRFKSPALANAFKKAFEEAVASAGSASSTTAMPASGQEDTRGEGLEQEGSTAAGSLSKAPDFAARFAPPQGSWNCEECYVTNKKDDMKCCACGKPRPGVPPQSSLPSGASEQPILGGQVTAGAGFRLGGMNLNAGSLLPPFGATLGKDTGPPNPAPSFTGSGFLLNPGTLLSASSKQQSVSASDKFSFSVSSTSLTTQPSLFGSSGGFKFIPPSQASASVESKPESQSEGMLRLEPRSSPPKSCSAGLDFASLFKTSTTASSTPFQFGLSINPPKIPSPTEQEPNDDLNASAHEPDIHFEPIVTLPEAVEITSGEENEEAVFAERAKLFRFDSSVEQWKERGVGEMKILVNREARKARVLMRRDQVLKICCNHVIMRDMSLTPMQGSNKACTWFTPGDFSEETETPEKFAVRFKSPALANAFKKAFEEAVASAGSASSTTAMPATQRKGEKEEKSERESSEGAKISEATGSSSKAPDFAARFAPPQGSWNCEECYVPNKKDDAKCCACGKSRPGVPPQPTLKPFSLPSTLAAPHTQGITFGARLQINPHLSIQTAQANKTEHSSSLSPSPSPSPSPPRRVSFNPTIEFYEDSEDDVVIVSVELPSEEKVKYAESLLLPPSFFNYEKQPPCPGCRGCIDLLTGPYEHASGSEGKEEESPAGTQAKLLSAVERSETPKKEEDLKPVGTSKDDEQNSVQPLTPPMSPPPMPAVVRKVELPENPLFGGSSTTPSASLSFADLASGGAGFLDKKGEDFRFSGVGQKLFTPQDEQDDPEREVNVHFKPVVTLPEAVKMKSWDDNAEVLFCRRTKLYRYDEHRKWKERGRGELKILRHGETGKVKLLMRRDQTLKICCNHSLTPDMVVTLLANDEKACTWFTNADYTEEVVSHEKLCAKFKNVECRDEFLSVFEKFKSEDSTGGEGEGEEGDEAGEEGEEGDEAGEEGEEGDEAGEEREEGDEAGEEGEEGDEAGEEGEEGDEAGEEGEEGDKEGEEGDEAGEEGEEGDEAGEEGEEGDEAGEEGDEAGEEGEEGDEAGEEGEEGDEAGEEGEEGDEAGEEGGKGGN